MMEQVDKELRQSPTGDDFMKEKRASDILYHFYQINSEYDGEMRYCYKKDCSYRQMAHYFASLNKQIPFSENTFRNINKILLSVGLIEKSTRDRRVVYILNQFEAGNYVFVKADTLRYLINTATPNVIKVYTYLKRMYNIYQKNSRYKNWTTKKELLEAIGYTARQDSYAMLNDILKCLEFAGLVEYNILYYKNDTQHVIPNIVINKVNDDVRKSAVIKNTNTSSEKIAVPLPTYATNKGSITKDDGEEFHF